jgi:hypothetical protein
MQEWSWKTYSYSHGGCLCIAHISKFIHACGSNLEAFGAELEIRLKEFERANPPQKKKAKRNFEDG